METKKIVVLGTGGTIAGKAAAAGDNIGYVAGQVGVQDLLAGVPGLAQAAQGPLDFEQVAQIDSKDMSWQVWQDLGRALQRQLDRDDVAGEDDRIQLETGLRRQGGLQASQIALGRDQHVGRPRSG